MADQVSTDPKRNTTHGVRRGAIDRRPLLMVLGGFAVAVLLVAAIWRLGDDQSSKTTRRIIDFERIVIPSVPTDEELAAPAMELDRDVLASLEQGASVQVADESGRLAQEYGAARIDPLPDAWISMKKPWARLHPTSGRVIEMEAIDGTMRVPDQAIEAGRLEGDVRIRLYEPGVMPGVDGGRPSVVIEATEAEYDAGLGEIRSRRRVRIETDDAIFVGEDLRIVLEQDGTRIERLTVARATEPIMIRAGAFGQPEVDDVAAEPRSRAESATDTASSVGEMSGASNVQPAREIPPADSEGSWRVRGDAPESANPPRISPTTTPGTAPDNVSPVDPESVYRLVLEDDVLIERLSVGPDGETRRSAVSGDRLVAAFQLGEAGESGMASMKDGSSRKNGLAAAFGESHSDPRFEVGQQREPRFVPAPAVVSRSAVIFGNALAAVQDETSVTGDQFVLVHYSGRLVMTPDSAAAKDLKDASDARLVVEGLEDRGIELEDDANGAVGSAARLEYRVSTDRVELIGDESHPLQLRSEKFSLDGGRFWFERSTSTGGLIGPGRMIFDENGARAVESAMGHGMDGVEIAIRQMLADSSGAGLATAQAVMAAIPGVVSQDAAKPNETAPPRLEIVWEGGVDLEFFEETDARLRQARFQGDVRVAGEAFQLGSNALVVDFDPQGDADAIDRILATGDARVDRVGESGSLKAKRIDLGLTRTEDGRTIPSEMIAEGGVAASDPSQTLWTERLVVTFRELDDKAEAARGLAGGLAGGLTGGMDAGPQEGAEASDADEEFGQIEVHTVLANEAVQVRLDEGARVFADRLRGDAVAGVLELTGEDVMVLRGNVIADRMQEVRLDDSKRTVRSPGPGRFRYYDQAVITPSKDRIRRPSPTSRTSLAATWREAMAYRQTPDGTGGRLDLEGDVRVRSTPDARTSDRLDAQSVGLDLVHGTGGVRNADKRQSGRLLAREGDTTLERLVARGDAVLESRAWDNDEKTGEPRLFRVTGDDVTYKVETGEATVEGKGGLLVHDPRGDENRKGKKPVEAGFGVDGTTRFTWARRMTMTREIDGRYLVVMDQDVEVLHAGLETEDTMTLTGDRLEVTIDRPEDEEPARAREANAGIELGGPAEIMRVRGLGRVFVRTPDHDVECEEFDYNVDTGIAILRAAPGRVVTVQSKAARTPIRAERVQWDLRSGRLRILGGEGGIVR